MKDERERLRANQLVEGRLRIVDGRCPRCGTNRQISVKKRVDNDMYVVEWQCLGCMCSVLTARNRGEA